MDHVPPTTPVTFTLNEQDAPVARLIPQGRAIYTVRLSAPDGSGVGVLGSIPETAAQILEVLRRDLPGPWLIAGYSSGGMLSWEVASQSVASAVGAGIATLTTHNRAIFNLATTATGVNAVFGNYKATVYLTPALRKLHEKLIEPRSAIGGAIVEALEAASISVIEHVSILGKARYPWTEPRHCGGSFLTYLALQLIL